MAQMVVDERIHETANITGTGEYTLAGAATGKQPLSVIGANNYAPIFVTDDINWEFGLLTYVSGPGRAQRTHIFASSNGGAAVNWNNATVKLKCGWPAFLTQHRQVSKSVAGSSNVTLTALEQRCKQLILTGALTGNIQVIVDDTKWGWTIYNNTSGAYTLTVKTASGTGVMIKQGKRAAVECDGANVVPLTNQNLIRGAFLTRSSNTILGLDNHGDTINVTASYTQTLGAAATLGENWFTDFIVDSGATLTIDPNSTETVDGSATKAIVGPAQGRLVCTGSAFRTIGFVTADAPVAGDVLRAVTATDAGGTTTSTSLVNVNGSNKSITPRNAESTLLIEVTFQGSIGVVGGVNTTAYFQLYDVENAVLIGANYFLSAPSGAGGNGAQAPITVRASISNSVTTARSFQLRARTDNSSGAAGAQNMLWSITEIKS
jgi:hypothetical protein